MDMPDDPFQMDSASNAWVNPRQTGHEKPGGVEEKPGENAGRYSAWGGAGWGRGGDLQGRYVRAIRAYRLLTPDEEIAYARQFSEARAKIRGLVLRFPQVILSELKKLQEKREKFPLRAFVDVEFEEIPGNLDANEDRLEMYAVEKLLAAKDDLLEELTGRNALEDGVNGGDEIEGALKKFVPGAVKVCLQQRFYSACVETLVNGELSACELGLPEYEQLCEQLEVAREKALWAMKRLVEANLRLVISIAKRYVCPTMSFADLVQEGNIGLMRAVEAFEYRLGHRFSTYASYRIRQAISSAISLNGRAIRMPVNILRQLSRIHAFERSFLQENGDMPAVEQVAQALELSVARIRALKRMSQQPISLQSMMVNGHEAGELIADERTLDKNAPKNIGALRISLGQAMDSLDDREREIISRRFGLNGAEVETLEQLAERFALTSERIRQLEAAALQKLRRPEAQQYLEDWR